MSEEAEEYDFSRLGPVGDSEPLKPEEPAPEAEVEDTDEAEQPTEEKELPAAESQPDSDPPPAEPSLMDKQLQKFQQLTATLERKMDALPKEGEPSEKQVKAVEKAKGNLDKYLEEADIDPYSAVPELTKEIMSNKSESERLMQDYEGKLRALEEREMQRDAEMARMRFSMNFPDLKGNYEQILTKAHEDATARLGDAIQTVDATTYSSLVNSAFVEIANREAEAIRAKEPEAPKEPKVKDTAKKPKATNIVKTNSGVKAASPQDSEARAEELLAKLGPLR